MDTRGDPVNQLSLPPVNVELYGTNQDWTLLLGNQSDFQAIVVVTVAFRPPALLTGSFSVGAKQPMTVRRDNLSTYL